MRGSPLPILLVAAVGSNAFAATRPATRLAYRGRQEGPRLFLAEDDADEVAVPSIQEGDAVDSHASGSKPMVGSSFIADPVSVGILGFILVLVCDDIFHFLPEGGLFAFLTSKAPSE